MIEKKIVLSLMIVLFVIFIYVVISIITYPTEDLIAYECPEDNKVQFEDHKVMYVVVDMQSRPCKDMLIEIICNSKIQHNVTQIDGSCLFRQSGYSNYTIRVYNKTMSAQKEFNIYPLKACYLLVT